MNTMTNREIPFGKPARVGNFKVWRSKKLIGKKRNKNEIEQINVSTLDGEWQVKIPSTTGMFSMLTGLFSRGDDGRLSHLFTNMFGATVTANGYYHHGLSMLNIIYTNPRFLDEGTKDYEDLLSDVEKLKKGFLEWRKEYDKMVAANEPTEEEMENDQAIDDILEEIEETQKAILTNEDGKADGEERPTEV